MAAAEVKTATAFAALASVLGPLAAEYSMILAGAIIGAAIGVSFSPKLPGFVASLKHFGGSVVMACGCALLFSIPLSAAAAWASHGVIGLDAQHLLFSVSGLIGLFWRDALPLIPIFGKRFAEKKLPPTDGST